MLQRVMKAIGMDIGESGFASRFEKVKDMRWRTLEWAEEGDSAQKNAEIERKAETKRTEKEKKCEKDTIRKEKLRQERLEQERLEEESQKEKKIERAKILEAEEFEEEKTTRRERRREIRKWLEEKKKFEDDLQKVKKEEKKQEHGREKVMVEIEDTEGKTLIEYERGKSETRLRVRMSNRPEPGGRGSHLGISHRHEGVSDNDNKLNGKPRICRSRGVSDLVKFFESQSDEAKTKNESLSSTTSRPSAGEEIPPKEALGVTKKPAENRAAEKHVNRRPEVQQVTTTNVPAPGPRQEPQHVEPKTPERQPSLLISKPKSSTFRPPPRTPQPQPPTDGKAKASTPVNEPPAMALKCRSQLPAKQENNGHASNTANSKKKLSPASQDKKEELSKSEKNDSERPPPVRRAGAVAPKGTNTVPFHQNPSKKPSASEPHSKDETSQTEKKQGHQQTQSCHTVPMRSKKIPEISTQAEGRGKPPVTTSKQEPLQTKPTKPEASKPDHAKETKPQRAPHATRAHIEGER